MFWQTENEWIRWLVVAVGGYLLGSVHFCRAIPLLLRRVDVTKESADGNPGAANVFALCGWQMGLVCLFCDMAKGFLPVFAAIRWLPPDDGIWLSAVMMGPVLGHAFSCLHRFRGGKCIATIFGEMIALLWISPVGLVLAGLYIFFSTAVKINPHSRRSIVTFSLFLPASLCLEFFLGHPAAAVGCAGISAVAIVKHLAAKDAALSTGDPAEEEETEKRK